MVRAVEIINKIVTKIIVVREKSEDKLLMFLVNAATTINERMQILFQLISMHIWLNYLQSKDWMIEMRIIPYYFR
jgi:hypothetical protein